MVGYTLGSSYLHLVYRTVEKVFNFCEVSLVSTASLWRFRLCRHRAWSFMDVPLVSVQRAAPDEFGATDFTFKRMFVPMRQHVTSQLVFLVESHFAHVTFNIHLTMLT